MNNVEIIASVVASFGIGMSVGYFLGKSKNNGIMIKAESDATDILNDAIEKEKEVDKILNKYEKKLDAQIDNSRINDIKQFERFEKMYASDSPKDDAPVEEPYEITAEEFNDDFTMASCEQLTYYQPDSVLVDESDNIVRNGREKLGAIMDILPGAVKDIIYVRNDAEEKLYEIIVYHDTSYEDDVVGKGMGDDWH